MTNNIQLNKDKTIFKLIYKICSQQQGGTCFDMVLLINTTTNEVLGMGKIKPTLPEAQDILCNLSGNWSLVNADIDDGINIAVEGKCINRTNKETASRKNAEINLSLEKDWRSGVASFKYLSGEEWLHGGYAQVELDAEENLSELTNQASLSQNSSMAVLH